MSVDNTIKIAVCDDQIVERDIIVTLIQKYADEFEYVINIDEYSSGEELLKEDINQYNLIILDIFMGELSGIETAHKIIKINKELPIIFCSTSNEFAQESYDVNALRYLTKPIVEKKFYQTLDKFFYTKTTLRMLTFKQSRMEESIYLSDVLWIEAGDHKSVIHTKNGDITTNTIFKDFCEDLKDADFIKPIRFALINLDAIATIPTDEIKLIDGTIVRISREMRKEVRKAYTDYKMKKLLKKGEIL